MTQNLGKACNFLFQTLPSQAFNTYILPSQHITRMLYTRPLIRFYYLSLFFLALSQYRYYIDLKYGPVHSTEPLCEMLQSLIFNIDV